MPTPDGTPDGTPEVLWVLTPLVGPPDRPYQYHAVASCPHGTTQHQIGGPVWLVMADTGGICGGHRAHTRCGCPTGQLVVRSLEGSR